MILPYSVQKINRLLSRLEGVKQVGDGQFIAFCPVHESDGGKHKPSLSIRITSDKILLNCFGGCETTEVLRSIGLKMSDLNLNPNSGHSNSTPQPEYEFTDSETGEIVFTVVHKMGVYRPGPDGSKIWGLDAGRYYKNIRGDWNSKKVGTDARDFVSEVRRPLYREREIIEAEVDQTIYICEGMKDADNLRLHGLLATSTAFGKWEDRFTEILAGRSVVIVADNDTAGKDKAEKIAKALHGKSLSIRVLHFEGRRDKFDVSDLLEEKDGFDRFVDLVAQCEEWVPVDAASKSGKPKEIEGRVLIRKPQAGIGDNHRPRNDAAAEIGEVLGRNGFFRFNGQPVRLDESGKSPKVQMLSKEQWAAAISEKVLFTSDKKGQEVYSDCTAREAGELIAYPAFTEKLPVLRSISPSAVLIRDGNALKTISGGFDSDSGIYACGDSVPTISTEEAKSIIDELLVDFKFATKADRARAVALLLAPALVAGGLIPGRTPMFVVEADQSQTGKGYLVRMAAAVYGIRPDVLTQRKGGVGSLDEDIGTALLRGSSFICVDNYRGRLDSPALESLLTEDTFNCRVPNRGAVAVDTRSVLFSMTSNGANMTADLSNRILPISLRKQPGGHAFQPYKEGDLICHVFANKERYLSAIFSIIREWAAQDYPRTDERRHSFQPWIQSVDWMIQNIFGLPPICDGLIAVKERVTTNNLEWLREVTLAVRDAGMLGKELKPGAIVNVLVDAGMECPGDCTDKDDKESWQKSARAVGNVLSPCFPEGKKTITVDGMTIEQRVIPDKKGPKRVYVFDVVGEDTVKGTEGGLVDY